MTVTKAYSIDHGIFDLSTKQSSPRFLMNDAQAKMFLIGNFCNHSHLNRAGENVGQATEVALMNVLPMVGLNDERKVSF